MKFSIRKKTHYPTTFLVSVIAVIAILLCFFSEAEVIKLSIAAIGVMGGFVYFLYSQHIRETEIFIELFQTFNEQYDHLNDSLNIIRQADESKERENSTELSPEDKQDLYDYFNLCAEEYLYYKSGYIDERVWENWIRGMKCFADSPSIRKLWEEELKTNSSYYGFKLDMLK